MNLKINGSEMIRGIYCKAGENAVCIELDLSIELINNNFI